VAFRRKLPFLIPLFFPLLSATSFSFFLLNWHRIWLLRIVFNQGLTVCVEIMFDAAVAYEYPATDIDNGGDK
jgi:hypothetical protein